MRLCSALVGDDEGQDSAVKGGSGPIHLQFSYGEELQILRKYGVDVTQHWAWRAT